MDFRLVGLGAGTAALTVGAIGPLIAPVFARHNFVKERLIATKAVCQLATHIVKIPAFILLRDLDLPRLGALALVMIVMVIPGTLIGKRLLKGVSEKHFRIAYRVALTDFLSEGGDGYLIFKDKPAYKTGSPLRELIVDTIRENKTVRAEKEKRIVREK